MKAFCVLNFVGYLILVTTDIERGSPDNVQMFSCSFDGITQEYTKWNKSISAKLYQESYCAVRCREGKRVALRSFNRGSQSLYCVECSCKKPECEHYGICCPGIEDGYVPLPEFDNETYDIKDSYGTNRWLYKGNRNLKYSSYPKPYNYNRNIVGFSKLDCELIEKTDTFLYIRSCFNDFEGDEEIRRLCEQDVSNDEVTVDYFAWAIDTATRVVYRNIFCAVCNRAIMPQQLAVRTYCKDYMFVQHITDKDEMLRTVLGSSAKCCTVEKEKPNENHIFSCNRYFFNNNIVSSCDSAPPEWHYDEDIVRACQELNHTIYRMNTMDNEQTYKNVFCAVCNMNSYPRYGKDSTCGADLSERVSLPFTLLINFGKISTVMSKKSSMKTLFIYANCSDRQWSSPDNGCLPLVCSPGKLLTNGSCVSAFLNIEGLHYSLNFSLFRQKCPSNLKLGHLRTEHELQENMNDLIMMIKQTLMNYSDAQHIKIECIIENSTNAPSSSANLKLLIVVESKLIAFKKVKRDDYEKTLIASLIDASGVFKLDREWILLFTSSVMAMNTNIGDWNGTSLEHKLHSKTYNYISKDYTENHCGVKLTKFVSVTRLLFCGYISFRPSHYNITVDFTTSPPDITVTVDLNVTKVNISTISELNMIEVDEDGNLKVCHEVLDRKLNDMEEVYRKSNFEYRLGDVNLAQYIVTMTSLGCSMICLISTISTYIWLPVLRNTAGKHNIFLCLSLLFAQTSLIITAHGPSQDTICMLTGVMTHFLWLWMFSWTFICSFHMFNVFTSSTRSQPATKREEKKKLIKRIICSLIGPTVIVVSVIAVSLISSGGEHIGYSHVTCYLNSELLVGFSMILPLALSIACNVAFFVKTVYSINEIRRLQTSLSVHKDNKENLLVYVKLSSTTGAFWTIAIIAEVVDVDALRIISILLNGFQGVLIFLSYICNKRVLNMITTKHSQTSTSISGSIDISDRHGPRVEDMTS